MKELRKNQRKKNPYLITVMVFILKLQIGQFFMSSAEYSCKLFKPILCIQANSVDPDQTAPVGAVCSGSTLFAKMTFKITSRRQLL